MNSTITPPQCPALREDLKAFVDGELSLLRQLTTRFHLSRCLLCQQEMREMKRIGREIRERESSIHDAAALSPEFRARLLTHLNPLMPVSAVGASRPAPYWRQQPLLVFGSGAVAVAVCTVVFIPLLKETPGELVATSAASRSVENTIVPIKVIKSVPAPKMIPPASVEAAAPAPAAIPAAPSINQAQNFTGARPLPRSLSSAAVKSSVAVSMPKEDARVSAAQAKAHELAYVVPPVPEVDRKRNLALNTYRYQKNETHVDVIVARLDAASQKVEELVTAGGGYIVNNNLSAEKNRGRRAEVTVKVPGEQVDSFLISFANLGEAATKKTFDNSQKDEVAANTAEPSSAGVMFQNQQRVRSFQKPLAQNNSNQRSRNNLGVTRTSEFSVITLSLQENPKKEIVKEQDN